MINKFRSLFAKLLLLTFPVMLTFCGDDDEGGSKLSYTIDGQSQKVETVIGVLQYEIQYDHEGRGLYITAAKGMDQMLSVAVSNWDYQNPPDEGVLEKEYDTTFDVEETSEDHPLSDCLVLSGDNEGVTLCDGGLISLISGSEMYTSVFDGNTNGSITITSCNAAKHTISGTFQATVADFDGAQQFEIAGSFTNVKYLVQ